MYFDRKKRFHELLEPDANGTRRVTTGFGRVVNGNLGSRGSYKLC